MMIKELEGVFAADSLDFFLDAETRFASASFSGGTARTATPAPSVVPRSARTLSL